MGTRVPSRMLLSILVSGFVATLILLALPQTTLARTFYATATGQPCSTCHTDPGGGGARNSFGRAFEAIASHQSDPAGAYAQLTSAAPVPTATPVPMATATPTAVAAPLPTAVPTAPVAPPRTETGGLAFRMGFADMAALIPSTVGTPLENEHYAANGDSLQMTSTGMMVWRKADNWTAFTDGNRSWINGPFGIQIRGNTELFPWERPTVRGERPESEDRSSGGEVVGPEND